MSTFIATVVWGAFSVGYVAILALTESAARSYVRDETRMRQAPAVVEPISPLAPTLPRAA